MRSASIVTRAFASLSVSIPDISFIPAAKRTRDIARSLIYFVTSFVCLKGCVRPFMPSAIPFKEPISSVKLRRTNPF